MADLPSGPTVLIVDKDFGFAFWLAEIFTELGCHPVPALDCPKAVSLTTGLKKIDVVVVNPAMPGISKMMQSLSYLYPSVKVVAVVDEKMDAVGNIQAHATLERPSGLMPISRQEWVRLVRQVLRDLEIVGGM